MPLSYSAVTASLHTIEDRFGRLILDSNYQASNNDNEVSWRQYATGILKQPYVSEHQELLDRKQYSFLFVDNSFAQFYFKFSPDSELERARLAFYPAPDERSSVIAESLWNMELFEEAIELAELGSSSKHSTHVRFDFDSRANTHDKAHIQYSSYNSLRFPAAHVPLPFAFLDFIFSHDSELLDLHQTVNEGQQYGAARTFAFSSAAVVVCASPTFLVSMHVG